MQDSRIMKLATKKMSADKRVLLNNLKKRSTLKITGISGPLWANMMMKLRRHPSRTCSNFINAKNCVFNWRDTNKKIKENVLEGFSWPGQSVDPEKNYCMAMDNNDLDKTPTKDTLTLTAKPCIDNYRTICKK